MPLIKQSPEPWVLVTGGSGFLAAHCIAKLLDAGYRVRATVRSLTREAEVREMVTTGRSAPGDRLAFAVADLLRDEGWSAAAVDCRYVLHIASPFPAVQPRDESELIVPAREGALRVLRASRDGGVKRLVLTSSFAAVGYSPKKDDAPYTEEDWTDPEEPGLSAYVKSKTLAERAAWELIAREGGALELAVVNPVGIFGPVLGKDYSTSVERVKELLEGGQPGMANVSFGLVDVRDVADLHVSAMTHPAARGERFLAVAGESMRMGDIAEVLRRRLRDIASDAQIPAADIFEWTARVGKLLDVSLRQLGPASGKAKTISHEKARQVLGWSPRTNEAAIIATAGSLVRLGLL
jgi:nucleoside-diphosphate-sugar epimerase